MRLSRRGFVRSLGLGTAGVLSSSFIIARGREEAAFGAPAVQEPYDDGVIRISSNENARGPGPNAIRAVHDTISPRAGRGYPPDHVNELVEVIAETHGVELDNVIVGTGSGPILEGAVHAFCSADRGLVTAAPTFGTTDSTARRLGLPVEVVAVERSLGLDLGAMAETANGAGLVFVCNPNNPTGTALPAGAVAGFVRQVKRRSADTAILIDEAYMDYAFDPEVRSAMPLALEFPRVFVTRTFSKAHGMAGLRVGYAIGQRSTVRAIAGAWHLGSMNTLSAAAAIASLQDSAYLDAEKEENARIRDFTLSAFRELGYEAVDSHTNHIFVNLGRPASWFRSACLERGVRVGRDFPPMERTHSRISLGTREEMEIAVGVFKDVLAA